MEYLQVFLLFFFCIGRCQQFGKADDGIQWRTNFMTHIS